MPQRARPLFLTAALSFGAVGLTPVTAADQFIPVAGEASIIEVSGTVASINAKTRRITIKLKDGSLQTYQIPDHITRVDQIDVGDKVEFTLTEAVLVDIETGRDAGAMASYADTKVDSDPGKKPSGTATERVTLYGKVISVDRAKSRVRIRGAEKTVDLAVQDQQILKKLKPGDGVIATYARAIKGKISVR